MPHSSSRRLRRGLLVLAALAALAGLFGMHGLGDHGTGHDGGSVAGHAGHVDPTSAQADGPTAGDPAHGHAMGAMGLCVAVLLVIGVVALRRGWWRVRPLAVAARALASVRRTARARAPDPPDLALLCVLRC